ncbi:MAG: SAM-dependent methyltransferase [Actinomycetota bacterium]
MATHRPAPAGVDTSTPNVARMYDYYLGGKNNFAADREAAERILTMVPELRDTALLNREFLGRAVELLAGNGIRQFIDIGSGLPTQGNVHEIAQDANPEARVVYVDNDPVVCAHGRALLERSEGVAVVQADLRQPEEILGSSEVRSLIDFDQPVAVLMVAILHFVPDDDDPAGLVAKFRDAMAPGSYLVVTHATADSLAGREEEAETGMAVYRSSNAAAIPRSRDQVVSLFDGFDLIEPGVVWIAEWGATDPVDDPEKYFVYAGVGRKP